LKALGVLVFGCKRFAIFSLGNLLEPDIFGTRKLKSEHGELELERHNFFNGES
jgi:hypothetical protein